ncbi:MAG: hypothetical protein JWP18_706 [Solirubrobacterales bacterium]|nr:hypothetical protein [Solirubrobacterales bacterium]
MTFLQNLWRDLVDKHLWPVAVALVLAVAAVPFLVDSGAPASTAAVPVTPAAPALGTAPVTAQIAVAAASGGEAVSRSGKSRDPFRPLVFAKTEKAPATASATTAQAAAPVQGTPQAKAGSGSTSGGSTATGGTSTTTSPSSSTTTPATTPTTITTTKTKLFTYAITVAVRRSGLTTVRRGVRAITYLPSTAYPLVTFLGVKGDGETATFLLSDGVVVLGKGAACRPSAAQCDVVELKARENVQLVRTPKVGEPVKRFRLALLSVGLREAVTAGKKAAARAKDANATAGPALPTDLAPARQVTQTRTAG